LPLHKARETIKFQVRARLIHVKPWRNTLLDSYVYDGTFNLRVELGGQWELGIDDEGVCLSSLICIGQGGGSEVGQMRRTFEFELLVGAYNQGEEGYEA
jgi:hypothetical protein